MIKKIIHKANSRGFADHGWLHTKYSFSFADYYNPERMGFGTLRVLNDDIIAPGHGFGKHPHRDMEIITIPLVGALEHKDSEQHQQVIRRNEIQVVTAGSGIFHSEYNYSDKENVQVLQIWILPEKKNLKPRYDQTEFNPKDRKNQFQLVVSPMGSSFPGLQIYQQAYISLADLDQNQQLEYTLKNSNNGIYLFVIQGQVHVNKFNSTEKDLLTERDAIGITGASKINLSTPINSSVEVVLFEVPMVP